MSDYNHTDGRPNAREYGPLKRTTCLPDELYLYNHGELIGLEISPWDHPCRSHGVLGMTLGLTPDAARDIAEQLVRMADKLDSSSNRSG